MATNWKPPGASALAARRYTTRSRRTGLKPDILRRFVLDLLCSACLIFICTGCLVLFGESFASRDSLDNATTDNWIVTPKFISEEYELNQHESYPQLPETYFAYQATGRGKSLPTLANIVVQLQKDKTVQYQLSGIEISKLREASGGELRLVLYDEGIGCLSPAIKAYFRKMAKQQPYNKQEHYQMLRDKKGEILRWTNQVLATAKEPKW